MSRIAVALKLAMMLSMGYADVLTDFLVVSAGSFLGMRWSVNPRRSITT